MVEGSEACCYCSYSSFSSSPLFVVNNNRYFEPDAVTIINGAIAETTELMSYEWGLIFFTGSERVGKIIAGAAAKTMTPCILELGGKSPLFVMEDIPELKAMCNRMVWGKAINAGQTCVAPDYVLCHEKNFDRVVEQMKKR